mmetsp:Transcript_13038/g.35785  ORF Transcript_13038/g.35785 Transcript_13038/m.35785 type:complete len:186 (-) Transcript_13038:212-769(-)|eukprot:CAMPEP_0171240034 /NCGR_PEP_ID=MMETSP0790-20130122/44280_1 /TAXON_ID=2925 /ORGANISM="Alexandrium catenella, Strain OF101" /LENGTH=185 /DNA_ID=CAMNT_0011706417 /DNA_START=77 /DNA_END=634 /DNA_ORIENTATION=-
MGYAGYSPGNTVADKLTPLQQALRALPLDKAQETLELIDKLTRNIVRNPTEEKFRRIKLTNPKIAAAITEVPFAVDVLKEMGWVEDGDGLALPPDVRLLHEQEVIGIIDAKDYFKKEEENERRRQVAARKAPDADKEALMKQMEVDRKEKDAEGPVTHGSVAKKLGDGPNIMRAGDLGIGKSAGG